MAARPETVLRAIADLAAHVAANWAQYETVEANLAHPTMKAAAAGDHGGDTPDPPHNIAWSHIRYHATVDDIHQALAALRTAQRTVNSVRRHHSILAAEHDAILRGARCSGGWDPTCTQLAVRNGECWRCYQARRRARPTPT